MYKTVHLFNFTLQLHVSAQVFRLRIQKLQLVPVAVLAARSPLTAPQETYRG